MKKILPYGTAALAVLAFAFSVFDNGAVWATLAVVGGFAGFLGLCILWVLMPFYMGYALSQQTHDKPILSPIQWFKTEGF